MTNHLRQLCCAATAVVVGIAAANGHACTVTLAPDGNTAAIQHAMDKPGPVPPVVCLKPGVYRGARLLATRSATLRRLGKDKVVLDAGGQGRVLTVLQDGIDVRLEGITLTNGKADRGGAVLVDKNAKLTLQDAWLYANTATLLGGGALAASSGQIDIVRGRITGNAGDGASAIDLSGAARARLFATLVADNESKGTGGAPIRLAGAAGLEINGSTVAYNSGAGVFMQPDGPGKRRLAIRSSIVMGQPDAIAVQRIEAGDVGVENSVLWGSYGFVALDLASQKALPGFNLKSAERYRPEKGSPAIGLGKCAGPLLRTDLAGKPRAGSCTAGALEAPAADIAATLAERRKQQARPKPKDWRDI